jgi:hypothetical protein
MSDSDRETRAAARSKVAVLHRTRLHPVEVDLAPTVGVAAVTLVQCLTRETWAMAGLPVPTYSRAFIPVKFVRGRLT